MRNKRGDEVKVYAVLSKQKSSELLEGHKKEHIPEGQRAASLRKELLGDNEETNLAELRLQGMKGHKTKKMGGKQAMGGGTSRLTLLSTLPSLHTIFTKSTISTHRSQYYKHFPLN